MLNGKKILLGISGGIAAYKTAQLIRIFVKAGAEVKVIVTHNALQFISKVTLETLSKNKIYKELFSENNDYSTEHIALTDWADLFVIAPATANIIGKFANGIADDVLSTSFLAFNKSIFIAPAMNCKMYDNFAVQKNITYLQSHGIQFIEAPVGDLACGYEGKGRMEEPAQIMDIITKFIEKKSILKGKKVLITAGPTYEAIDPVRYIGNHSSGKMGFALAKIFADLGANVCLLTGPVHLEVNHPLIKRIDIITASEMFEKCIELFPTSDYTVMAAAVADFTIDYPSENKIKKSGELPQLKLIPTIDILAELGKIKRENQLLIGFALETDKEKENALNKLNNKKLDFIVLNSLRDAGSGFGHETNKVSVFDKEGGCKDFSLKSKLEIAKDIISYVLKIQF
ncbi:MAG: bifunctional phosphopantothenoylcysteine decarboxylase/phosphopantothenate--cysteine ligase CoaBC [Bacteroidales bacterium]